MVGCVCVACSVFSGARVWWVVNNMVHRCVMVCHVTLWCVVCVMMIVRCLCVYVNDVCGDSSGVLCVAVSVVCCV